MTKKDNYIVRSNRTGTVVKLPDGRRVHTLDRTIFNDAVKAANNYISERKSATSDVKIRVIPPVQRRELG